LKTRFYAVPASEGGHIGISLNKYESTYRASVDSAGKMVIIRRFEGEEKVLASSQVKLMKINGPTYISFANVDHQLIFEVGKDKLSFDLGLYRDNAGPRNAKIEPRVEIFGSGKITLTHVAVFRDIHYTSSRFADGTIEGRASEGNPLQLEADQFFVLGDNSPNSEDGRWWDKPGKGNDGVQYREGIVPRDYLVGKAVFVYWPAGFKLELGQFKSVLAFIPNIGKMRFIYGGEYEKN
jgi:hypothetical protein